MYLVSPLSFSVYSLQYPDKLKFLMHVSFSLTYNNLANALPIGALLLFYNLYSIWTSKGSAAASSSLISSAKLHPSARYAACDSFEE